MTRPPLTQSELARLRRKAEAATPGERYAGPHYGVYLKMHIDNMPGGSGFTYSELLCAVRPCGVDDQAFIAATNPTTVLALLDTIARLREALETIEEMADMHDNPWASDYARQALASLEQKADGMSGANE